MKLVVHHYFNHSWRVLPPDDNLTHCNELRQTDDGMENDVVDA